MKRFYHVDRYIQERVDQKRETFITLRNIQQKCSSSVKSFTKEEIQVIKDAVESWLGEENGILERVAYMRFQDEHRHTWTDYHSYGEDTHIFYKKCNDKKCDCQKYHDNGNGEINL